MPGRQSPVPGKRERKGSVYFCVDVEATHREERKWGFTMKNEAALKEWGELYAVASRIGERKPWERFWDMDLIGVQDGDEEDTVFFSVLGRGGECYGIAVYEGYSALNQYMMMLLQETLNLSAEYAMYNQRNLTCYWGSREELSEAQRKTIRELGYKYRGKNKWLYFQSFEPGYAPYNLNRDEVLRMTEHLKNLEFVLQQHEQSEVAVDFKSGNMLSCTFGAEKKTWEIKEKPLPFIEYQFGKLVITEEELLLELKQIPKSKMILEVDISYLGAAIKDKKYDRPINPGLCLIAEARSGMMLKCRMRDPGEDMVIALAEEMVEFIFRFGVPKELRVSNVIVQAGLMQMCETCGIELCRVEKLEAIDNFMTEMERFR